MDLKEAERIKTVRHPWETARLKALQEILQSVIHEGMAVLDVGCGDGYISRCLFDKLASKTVTAVDINLSDEWMNELATLSRGIRYQREMPEPFGHELVLLLDVIEHLENDESFLSDIVEKYIADNGTIMITAPAFGLIYGRHDIFLGHFRRYNLKELEELSIASGLKVVSSGYLFSTLLLPKLLFYKLLKTDNAALGAGSWGWGSCLTRFIEKILVLDNRILIAAGRRGVRIPGLTGWLLCEKR